jgi:hypothetical protein
MADSIRQRSGRLLPLLVAAAVAGVGALVFALRPGPDDDRESGRDLAAPPPEPLCEGWPSPAAVLVLTGEQHGYLEPCGCTERQMGGLERRADLVRQLREVKGWPVAALDLGGAPHPERVKRVQERMKFTTTRAALRAMGYEAMAVGAEELQIGPEELFTIYSNEDGSGDTSPEFLAANVTLYGQRDVGTPLEWKLVEAGGVKVAVTSVIGNTVWRRLFGESAGVEQTNFGFEKPAAALARVLPLMQEAQPSLRVLLSHAEAAESRELAQQFPDFDVVVTAGGYEDGDREPEPIGKTLFLQVGQKGKHAGVLGIFPEGTEPRLRFELVDLDKDRFASSPEIHALMEQYVASLKTERPDRTEPEFGHPRGPGYEYVGAETCGTCHKKAWTVWSNTRHSHAYESLATGGVRAKEARYIDRTFDAECLCCHTTGWDPQQAWRYRTGFVDLETTPHLAGQQCENCHGPGSRHVELEQAWRQNGGAVTDEMTAARKELQLQKETARTSLCVKCHDHDNSPTFDTPEKPFEAQWWQKIAHPGKD